MAADDQHDKAIRAVLQGNSKGEKHMATKEDDGAKTLFTMEIKETAKPGVYALHAYDETGLQIGQTPCVARASNVIAASVDLIVNAGLTDSLPLIGVEDFQRGTAVESPTAPTQKLDGDPGPGFTDMVEGLAKWLNKAGRK